MIDADKSEQHRQRCETCGHHKLVGRISDIDECDILDHTPSKSDMALIRRVGCASHTSTPAIVRIITNGDVACLNDAMLKQAASEATAAGKHRFDQVIKGLEKKVLHAEEGEFSGDDFTMEWRWRREAFQEAIALLQGET